MGCEMGWATRVRDGRRNLTLHIDASVTNRRDLCDLPTPYLYKIIIAQGLLIGPSGR